MAKFRKEEFDPFQFMSCFFEINWQHPLGCWI